MEKNEFQILNLLLSLNESEQQPVLRVNFSQFLNSVLAPTVFKIWPKIQIKIFLLVVTVSVCDMPKILERMKRLPAL